MAKPAVPNEPLPVAIHGEPSPIGGFISSLSSPSAETSRFPQTPYCDWRIKNLFDVPDVVPISHTLTIFFMWDEKSCINLKPQDLRPLPC